MHYAVPAYKFQLCILCFVLALRYDKCLTPLQSNFLYHLFCILSNTKRRNLQTSVNDETLQSFPVPRLFPAADEHVLEALQRYEEHTLDLCDVFSQSGKADLSEEWNEEVSVEFSSV